MFSLELKTIEQWVTVTECLVHMSYEEYSSIINHLFQRVSTLLTLTQSAILSFWVHFLTPFSYQKDRIADCVNYVDDLSAVL